MTKVSLRDGNFIICDRCGTWHKSESEHKKHLQTICNADLQRPSENTDKNALSSTVAEISPTQQSSLMTNDTGASSGIPNIQNQAALTCHQQSSTTPLISHGN